ncbi:hypothetical protein G7Y79_00034g069570 [Physcia stellaris]|nr:hypothetical protein G7Y79_00034g069570 [Physcia stellaris]
MSHQRLPTPEEDPTLWANSNGQVLSASVVLLVLPTVFVALRLISRWVAGAGLWWDDTTAILGMALSWGCNITNILSSRSSLGRHAETLPLETLVSFYQHVYAFEIMYSLAMTCLKCSVVLFLYRIFPIVTFRRIIIACGVFVLAFGTASTLVFVLECVPISDFWLALSGGLKSRLRGRCISIHNFLLANGSINTATDILLLILPLPILWRLKARKVQKCVLTSIFITGLVVVAVSMVRLFVMARYHGKDFTYDFLPTLTWTAAEPSIAVVSTCLPSLRPLFVRLFHIKASQPPLGQDDRFSSSSNLASTWRNGSKVYNQSFNRLPVAGKSRPGSVSHDVTIYGGKGMEANIVELDGPHEEELEQETPMNRIRAKTTVVLTVSDRVEWQDDLF